MKCSEIILITQKLLSELRIKLNLEQKIFCQLAEIFKWSSDPLFLGHHQCTGKFENQPWLTSSNVRSMSQMFPSWKNQPKIGTWKNIHRLNKRFYVWKKITEYQIAVKIESIKVAVCIFFSFIRSFHEKFIHNFYADYGFRRRVKKSIFLSFIHQSLSSIKRMIFQCCKLWISCRDV